MHSPYSLFFPGSSWSLGHTGQNCLNRPQPAIKWACPAIFISPFSLTKRSTTFYSITETLMEREIQGNDRLAESSCYTLISDNTVLAQLDPRNIENSQQKRLKQENTECLIRIIPEKKACDCLGLYPVEKYLKYLPWCLQPHPRRSWIKKKKKSTIRKTCLQRVILAVTGLFRKVFGKIASGMRIHLLYHHLGICDYKGWLLSQFTKKATQNYQQRMCLCLISRRITVETRDRWLRALPVTRGQIQALAAAAAALCII